MTVTISPTEYDVFAAMRTVLLGLVPVGIEVIRAEDNRVPEPKLPNFIVMSAASLKRLSTNYDTFVDGFLLSPQVPGTRTIVEKKQFLMQLDVHGPTSGDLTGIITALLRDEAGCQAFSAVNPNIQPLYCGEPRQRPYQNTEDQYEFRYTVDVYLQVNTSVVTTQDYASSVVVTPVNVDATYPPGVGS